MIRRILGPKQGEIMQVWRKLHNEEIIVSRSGLYKGDQIEIK
jgi:hypothetical protein